MKVTTITALLLCSLYSLSSAQVAPPVTANLMLNLDAASGYTVSSGNDVWKDQSGNGNDVTAINSTTAEPAWVSNASGTGYAGVRFDGSSDVMTRLANSTTGFSNPNATIFIVRIANTAYTTLTGPYTAQWNVMLGIGENNTFSNDFSMMGNWAQHSSVSGNWVHRDHSCYSSLSDCLPAITTGVMRTGVGPGDLDYYINGVISTNTPHYQGSPSAYTSAARGIVVGASWSGTPNSIAANTYFQGTILKMLAYDRVLSSGEIRRVHDYLKKRYNVLYNCGRTECDPDFSWSMNTTLPNSYTFTAQNPNLPYKYKWTVNGGPVVSTSPTYTMALAPTVATSYRVCLSLEDCNGETCSTCFDFCHGDRAPNTDDIGTGNCNNHFVLSGNTNTPNQVTLTASGAGPHYWDGWFNSTPLGSLTGNPVTYNVTSGVSYYGFRLNIGAANGSCNRTSKNHCFYNNTPSPYRLGLEENNSRAGINPLKLVSVMPNPATDMVRVQLSEAPGENTQLKVTDVSGKTVYYAELGNSGSMIEVPVQNFAAGMYFLNVQSRGMILTGKFIKQ